MSDVRIVFVMLQKLTYNVSRDRFGGCFVVLRVHAPFHAQ